MEWIEVIGWGVIWWCIVAPIVALFIGAVIRLGKP